MEELTKVWNHLGSWFQKASPDFREWNVQKFREFHEKVNKFSRISRDFPQKCLLGKHSWELFSMEPSEDLFPRISLIFLRFWVPNLENNGGPISRIFVSSFL